MRAEVAFLGRVEVFPIRHHSPRSAAVVSTMLDQVRPSVVLIEAPADASHLIDVLVDPRTRPPVAILGYRTDGVPGSSLWPFAAYSPEYVAAKWAAERGARAEFIDVPVGIALSSEPLTVPEELADALCDEPYEGELDVHRTCTEARGFRTFEEFWEASFEVPTYDVASFKASLLAYADLVRSMERSPLHRARDAFMARRIRRHVLADEKVAVVVGAAHAASFVRGDVELALAATLPDPVRAAVTLVPFSFPRLAEQLGYGAGNRAPQFYQRVHDRGGSFQQATLEVLVELTTHLGRRGYVASLADTLEAYRLSIALAELRGKASPGLDELREAAVATLCRGDDTHIDGFLWPSVIGSEVGRVSESVGRNSLEEEFWREVEQRRLPRKDALVAFTLRRSDPVQAETSVFLHRLRIADIPYASLVVERHRPPGRTVETATRFTETWEAQWTPTTDAALVERILFGETLERVADRVLAERLLVTTTTGEAASIVLEATLAGSPVIMARALEACDRLAVSDRDLSSLARTAHILANLAAYPVGAAATLGQARLAELCRRTYDRAVQLVPEACRGDRKMVASAMAALRTLHEMALGLALVDREAWILAARKLTESDLVNPSAAGLALGLLHLSELLPDEEVRIAIERRTTETHEPFRAASFLEGYLEVNGTAMVKNRSVVAVLDRFLLGIPPSRFRDMLPILRRAFRSLDPVERRLLLENVLGLHRRGGEAPLTTEGPLDEERAGMLHRDLDAALDDLNEVL